MSPGSKATLTIKPVASASLFETVSRQLRRAIVSGEVSLGSRLPSETGLAARFGVSRTVIREAIAHLRSEGLVVTYQGKGMFVASTSSANVLRFTGTRHDRESLSQLFELRAVVEIGAAELAARHRSLADLAKLKRSLASMKHSIEREDAEGGADADVAFHFAVTRATRNPYFGEVLDFLRGRFREAVTHAWANSRATGHGPYPAYAEHERIFAAIVAADPVAAARATRIHVDKAAARLGFARPAVAFKSAPSKRPRQDPA